MLRAFSVRALKSLAACHGSASLYHQMFSDAEAEAFDVWLPIDACSTTGYLNSAVIGCCIWDFVVVKQSAQVD